ncbi:uncharacterized protein [Dermacentor albipictus]|uniref:uncharacterized protein isoform X2 n=1 Tax=Dermacentor albipictus TaxID=60249 RepID=UPI0038FC7C0C
MGTCYCVYDYMLRKKYQRAAKVGGQTTRFALALQQLVVCSCFLRLVMHHGLCLHHGAVLLKHHKHTRRAHVGENYCGAQPAPRRHRMSAAFLRHPRLARKPQQSCAQFLPRHSSTTVLEGMLGLERARKKGENERHPEVVALRHAPDQLTAELTMRFMENNDVLCAVGTLQPSTTSAEKDSEANGRIVPRTRVTWWEHCRRPHARHSVFLCNAPISTYTSSKETAIASCEVRRIQGTSWQLATSGLEHAHGTAPITTVTSQRSSYISAVGTQQSCGHGESAVMKTEPVILLLQERKVKEGAGWQLSPEGAQRLSTFLKG